MSDHEQGRILSDAELLHLLALAEQGDKAAATQALTGIAGRLLAGHSLLAGDPALPTPLLALCGGLLRTIKRGGALQFMYPDAPKRPVGRPKGAKKNATLADVLRLYGEAQGIIPEERRATSPRHLQRIRAGVRGAPGKPGRPKKSDKK